MSGKVALPALIIVGLTAAVSCRGPAPEESASAQACATAQGGADARVVAAGQLALSRPGAMKEVYLDCL